MKKCIKSKGICLATGECCFDGESEECVFFASRKTIAQLLLVLVEMYQTVEESDAVSSRSTNS